MLKYCDDNGVNMLSDPTSWLIEAHNIAHNKIKEAFRTELESQGFEVVEATEGFSLAIHFSFFLSLMDDSTDD
jgi:hypothetical protein